MGLTVAGFYFYFAMLRNTRFYSLLDCLLDSVIVAEYDFLKRQIKSLLFINKTEKDGEIRLLHYFSPLFLSGCIFPIIESSDISYISFFRYSLLPALLVNFAILFLYRDNLRFNILLRNPQFYIKILDLFIAFCILVIAFAVINYLFALINWIYDENAKFIIIIFCLVFYVGCVLLSAWFEFSKQHILSNLIAFIYYLSPTIGIIFLVAFFNFEPFIAIFCSIIFLSLIILSEEAIKSSFLQQIRLKKPHLALELYSGLKRLYNANAKAWVALIKPVTFGAILIAIFLLLYLGIHAANMHNYPLILKAVFFILLIYALPNRIPFLLRYIFLLKLSDFFLFDMQISKIIFHFVLFYSLVACSSLKDNLRKKQHCRLSIIIYILPFLMLLNHDILLASVANIKVIMLIIFIKIIALIALLAVLEKRWVRVNSSFENIALLFAAIILFCPNWFLSNEVMQYLISKNAQNAVKYVEYFPALCMVSIIYLRQKWSAR